MNGRRRECALCRELIAFRVSWRWENQPVPVGSLQYADVCANQAHVDHFRVAWEGMGSDDGEAPIVVEVTEQAPPPPLPKGMNVQPKRRVFDPTWLQAHWSSGYGVLVECEFISPESRLGAPATLHVPDDMVLPLMKVLREYSIDRRSQPLEGATVDE